MANGFLMDEILLAGIIDRIGFSLQMQWGIKFWQEPGKLKGDLRRPACQLPTEIGHTRIKNARGLSCGRFGGAFRTVTATMAALAPVAWEPEWEQGSLWAAPWWGAA